MGVPVESCGVDEGWGGSAIKTPSDVGKYYKKKKDRRRAAEISLARTWDRPSKNAKTFNQIKKKKH